MNVLPIVNHSLKYNPSLDGLRGIAISLVLLFHIWPEYFSFGYVGVDIFFVLSGFLITQIIYTKFEKNDFSLKEFYRNRIRRIFPAMIIVVLTTFIIGYLFLFPSELSILGKHIKSSILFYENFRLIGETGYWDTEAQLKPLLHFWSLSIEEQFYLFWPLVIILIYKFRLNLLISLSVIFILFSLVPLFGELNNFYHSLSRFNELAFGGLIFAFSRFKLSKTIKNYKFIIYILFIISIAFAYGNTKYHFLIILGVLISSGLVILSILSKNSKLLSSKVLVFLGLISFPLYLWHYVLISYMHIFGFDVQSLGMFIIMISIILSFLTYRYVEIYARAKSSYKFAGILFSVSIIIGLLGQFTFAKKGIPQRSHLSNDGLIEQQYEKMEHNNKNGSILIKKILGYKPQNDYIRSTSSNINDQYVLIVGDSHAHTSYLGLSKELKKRGFESLLVANSGCAPYRKSLDDKSLKKSCIKKVESIYRLIDNIEFLSNFEKIIFITRKPKNMKKEFDLIKIHNLFQEFSHSEKEIYYVIENPFFEYSPDKCLSRPFNIDQSKYNCKIAKDEYVMKNYNYLKDLHNQNNKYSNIKVLDPTNVFCDDKYCYSIKDETVLYTDTNHHSVNGSLLQAKYLIKEIIDEN